MPHQRSERHGNECNMSVHTLEGIEGIVGIGNTGGKDGARVARNNT